MNKTKLIPILAIFFFILIFGNPFFIVYEGKQAIITQFGEPKGEPIVNAGLHLKMPFIQKVTYFEKRLLEWDGYSDEAIPTKDGKLVWVDYTARWKIVKPLKFFQSVRNESQAQGRLDDIIDSEATKVVSSNNLIEIVRSTNDIIKEIDLNATDIEFLQEGALESIMVGRDKMQKDIFENSKKYTHEYGIELVDVRIRRVNYDNKVKNKVYERMIAERKRAAEQYRSEGRGERAKVEGRTEKELKLINSQAYKESQIIKGKAEGESTKIYADAYSKDPEFYAFLKTLQTYENTVDTNTTLILTTDSEYFKYLKKITP